MCCICDCTIVSILQKRTIGEVLLSEVFKHLGLEETDYFGLQYLDNKEQVVRATSCTKQSIVTVVCC